MKNKYMITPQWVLEPLGQFDLDPCTPAVMPWTTAQRRYTEKEDGLIQPWSGRVWMNPPYNNIEPWMQRIVTHGNGIGLTFAKTETQWFDQYVWEQADGLLFIHGRIYFCDANGQRSSINAPSPSVLIAYGEQNVDTLYHCDIKGKRVLLNRQVLFVAASPSWKNTVSIAVRRAGDGSELKVIYAIVELIAPDKCLNNKFWREKVRQKIYSLRNKIQYEKNNQHF